MHPTIEQENAFRAHCAAVRARRLAKKPTAQVLDELPYPPGLSAIQRAVYALEVLTPISVRQAEADTIKKFAIYYVHDVHLPHLQMADWTADEIIDALRKIIIADGHYLRANDRHQHGRTFRRMVRTAYLAERLARLRHRKFIAETFTEECAVRAEKVA